MMMWDEFNEKRMVWKGTKETEEWKCISMCHWVKGLLYYVINDFMKNIISNLIMAPDKFSGIYLNRY